MSNESRNLKAIVDMQKQLYTIESVLDLQLTKQEQLRQEMIEMSSSIISELRILSLARSHFDDHKPKRVKDVIKSQFLQGLSFSALNHCPSFFEPSKLSKYIKFITFLRLNPNILAQCLYYYSFSYPEEINSTAYSLFLSIFQQGWCIEEDELLSKTLIQLAKCQFENYKKFEFPQFTNILIPSLSSTESTLQFLEPFASFFTAYLFNGASFSYLQCCLSNILNIILSSPFLRTKKNVFTVNDRNSLIASFDYWEIITDHCLLCYNSLLKSLKLLPPGFFELFKFINSHDHRNQKSILLFFESFVNRALDHPSILGLHDWYPQFSGWSPLQDIALVFRSKYSCFIPSKFQQPLNEILSTFPSYNQINIDYFIEQIVEMSSTTEKCSSLISETELLQATTTFPKDLMTTGRDICHLHNSALVLLQESEKTSFKFDDSLKLDEFKTIVNSLGEIPIITDSAHEHFRIEIRPITKPRAHTRRTHSISLFSDINERKNIFEMLNFDEKELFQNSFCRLLAELPPISTYIETTHPKNLKELLQQLSIIVPSVIDEEDVLLSRSLLFYAMNYKLDEAPNSSSQNDNTAQNEYVNSPLNEADTNNLDQINTNQLDKKDANQSKETDTNKLDQINTNQLDKTDANQSYENYANQSKDNDTNQFQQNETNQSNENSLLNSHNNVELVDIHNIDLISLIGDTVSNRESKSIEQANKTTIMFTQYDPMLASLNLIIRMRTNVQSHLLARFTSELIRSDLNTTFRTIMSKSHEMQTDQNAFNTIIENIATDSNAATHELTSTHQKNKVIRYLFFTVTGNVTLSSYIRLDQNLWKKSVIVAKTLENNKDEIISSLRSQWKLNHEKMEIREKYLNRSINLLGNIRMNSGLSICLYFTVHSMRIIDELIDSSDPDNKSEFNSCIQYVIVKAKIDLMLNVYALKMAISHFFIKNTSQDYILQADEMKYLGIFNSAVAELLAYCGKYDNRFIDY